MANFKAYPGLFVRIIRDVKQEGQQELKEGQILQLLSVPRMGSYIYSFVGINGGYNLSGKDIEPVYDYRLNKDDN